MGLFSLTIDEFSYAEPDDPYLKKLVIRVIERLSGQPVLKRMYLHHQEHPVAGESFWDAVVRYLRLHLVYDRERLAALPQEGPLVVVANHPFGVLDGIVACCLVSRVRPDFKILTNDVLDRAPEIRPYLYPIDFSGTEKALETNLRSRALARDYLGAGGCLILFPAGGISTSPATLGLWGKAVDAEWGGFTAGLIQQAKATVMPFFFFGQNSRVFQIASHISMTLRLALIFREVYNDIGGDIRLGIGRVIPYAELAGMGRKVLMGELRKRTYALEAGS